MTTCLLINEPDRIVLAADRLVIQDNIRIGHESKILRKDEWVFLEAGNSAEIALQEFIVSNIKIKKRTNFLEVAAAIKQSFKKREEELDYNTKGLNDSSIFAVHLHKEKVDHIFALDTNGREISVVNLFNLQGIHGVGSGSTFAQGVLTGLMHGFTGTREDMIPTTYFLTAKYEINTSKEFDMMVFDKWK